MRPLLAALLLAATASTLTAQSNDLRQRAFPFYKQGLEALRLEAWERAAAAFEQAVGVDDKFEMAYYGLGRALMPQRKFAQAVAAFSKSADLFRAQGGRQFTSQQDAQRYRADRLLEIDEVIRQYQQGPQTLQSQNAIRQLQEQKRDINERIQRGMSVSLEQPVPAYLSLALGSAYFRMGKLEDAEREYKATLAADARAGEAHSNLAVVYLETGRVEDADKSVKAAEKVGFKVNPQLKQDIQNRRKGS